jgi:hypothetical protein
MGWSFRKSVKLGGGVRLNFSKSGVGVSAGVKGFRVSSNRRGSYVTIGGNGIYYRQRIASGSRTRAGGQSSRPTYDYVDQQIGTEIPTAGSEQLIDATSASTISSINDAIGQTSWAWVAYLSVVVLFFVLLGILPWAAVLAGAAAAYPLYIVYKTDKINRTFPLFFELEGVEEQRWQLRKQCLRALSMSSRIWRIETSMHTWDWKRHGGATELVTRRPVSVLESDPPHLATNVKATCIPLGRQTLVFLPDRLYVYENGRYGSVPYEELSIEHGCTEFVESLSVPQDAHVLRYSWLHPNKNGGPDRRFSHNPQIPIVEYGVVVLRSATGLNIFLQTSSIRAATEFASLVQNPRQAQSNRAAGGARATSGTAGQSSQGNPPGAKSGRSQPQEDWCFGVLGLKTTCSRDEAAAAYRALAKQYHPDLVAHMAPEFRTLAQERMTMINEAYTALRKAKSW